MKSKLLSQYDDVLPHAERIYVHPEIPAVSRHNAYLQLLYRNIAEQRPALKIESLRARDFFRPVCRRVRGERSILHHHWFEFHDLKTFALWGFKTACMTLYRLAGGKIIWTLHNRQPHHARMRRLQACGRRYLAALACRLHVHCGLATDIMTTELCAPRAKFFVIEHPRYPATFLPKQAAVSGLKKHYPQLDIAADEDIYLMLGRIAPYKGIAQVLRLFARLRHDNKKLLVAGEVAQDCRAHARRVMELASATSNMYVIPAYIPEQHIPLFMNAADTVVFNYSDILTSGGVALAQSYNKRVIVPDKGCLRELPQGPKVCRFGSADELERLLGG